MKIALIGAGSSVGRYLLALDDPRFIGIYRSPKALSQLCDLNAGPRLIRVSSAEDMARAIAGADSVVTLINDENPRNALNSLREVVEACAAAKVPQLIHLGSAAIYGAKSGQVCTSESAGPSITWNSYGAGKQWQENLLKRSRKLPPSTVVLRPGLIWGPGMAWLHAPAGEVIRGDAWIAEGDAPCNLVNINFLAHVILRLAEQRPPGLTFTNVRDRETGTWSDYYARIAAQFSVADFQLNVVARGDATPWKGKPGAARSTFPYGLGWSVFPKPLKNLIKKIAKSLPRRIHAGLVRVVPPGPGFSISREVWELKTADGLPPSSPMLADLQRSYPRTSEQDWAQLDALRLWMFA